MYSNNYANIQMYKYMYITLQCKCTCIYGWWHTCHAAKQPKHSQHTLPLCDGTLYAFKYVHLQMYKKVMCTYKKASKYILMCMYEYMYDEIHM